MKSGYMEPCSLLQALDDPLLALAAAVVLQSFAEWQSSYEAYALINSEWFEAFADAIESDPDRLRSRLGVTAVTAEPACHNS